MDLVAGDQIPTAVGGRELVRHVLVVGELVEAGDDEVVLQEPLPVRAASSLSLVRISNGR